MSGATRSKQLRRGAGQWRELLARFEASGLAVAPFCRRESVSTASFYRWRGRLGAESGALARKAGAAAAFVDLGAVSAGMFSAATAMELRLELGNGLCLHLVRR